MLQLFSVLFGLSDWEGYPIGNICLTQVLDDITEACSLQDYPTICHQDEMFWPREWDEIDSKQPAFCAALIYSGCQAHWPIVRDPEREVYFPGPS